MKTRESALSPREKLDLRVWYLLAQTRRFGKQLRSRELREMGLTITKAMIFTMIQLKGDKVTPSDLARWTIRTPHATSTLIERMTREGILRKEQDPRRKNVVRVTVTEKGQVLSSRATQRHSIQNVFSGLSDEELSQLESLLSKVRVREAELLGLKDLPPLP